jgi:hypothetical protein
VHRIIHGDLQTSTTERATHLRLDGEQIFAGDDEHLDDADERRTFRREELTACESCGRLSPPTRITCLYCGAELPAPHAGEDLRRPALKPLEEGVSGFNVVLVPREVEEETRDGRDSRPRSSDALDEVASLLRLKPEQLGEILAARVPLPLARTGERAEVALLERRLSELGLHIEIVSDDDLAVETVPPRRIRRMVFGADDIKGSAGAGFESWREEWGHLSVIVTGRVYRKVIEIDERVKRGAGGEVVDTRELTRDEAILDLYFAGERAGWRIMSEGFDYSCLGARKSLLAAENFARLVETLRERAPRAAFDDSYKRVRHLLQFAWSPTERTESSGLRHTAPGKFLSGAVTSTSNEAQFTRYSRLISRYARRKNEE